MIRLEEFIRESNMIEGIYDVTPIHVQAHEVLLSEDVLTVQALQTFVSLVQPGAVLRDKVGLNVRVGPHIPPPGGPKILEELLSLVRWASMCKEDRKIAYDVHQAYEHLHPFTDGNGRSGRAIWLWMHGGYIHRNFLHDWYYMSLQFHSTRANKDYPQCK